jgi:diguanylate cyclase (GGDEF)-like protein
MRILLIENNEDDVRLIQEHLAWTEVPVALEWADRISTGLHRLAAGDVDVVLLDLGLPDSTGLDGLVRLHTQAPAIPIVVLTGSYQDEQIALKALREGAQDYLSKERVDGEAIVRAMRYAIERSQTHQELKGLNETLEKRTVELERANVDLNTTTQELQKANEHLKQLALIDPLTNLLNRRGLEQVLAQEIQRGRREGSMLLALLVDLDDFKQINDALGFTVGDRVLVQITRKLRASLRATDHAGRIGGDEFMILLPRIRPGEGSLVGEKLRRAVFGTPIPVSPTSSLTITASLGLVQVSEATTSLDEVLSQTQSVLRRSKRAGKDRVSYDERLGAAQVSGGSDVRDDLLSVLRRGDAFRAVRQPIFSLDEMKPIGYELLTRLSSQAYEMPDDFFQVSREANLLTLVDHHCFKTCAAAAHGLPPEARRHLNLFPSTIVDIPVPQLLGELHASGRPGTSCIEISEQQVLGDASYLAEAVRTFQQAGVLIAIDDVGFGRSSLESLVLLQPEIVKIDKGCVRGIGADKSRARLFKRLLNVLESLGAEAVAEGIESTDDLDTLRALGVKYGQGFLLGEPRTCEASG